MKTHKQRTRTERQREEQRFGWFGSEIKDRTDSTGEK